MRRINSSSFWLKVLIAPFIVTFTCGGISVALFFTIGLPSFEHAQVKWVELDDELKASDWCFEQHYENGHKRTFCGVRSAQGKLMLEQSLDGRSGSTPISEYFAGAEPVFGRNWELYWEGFNIYYGFYPGSNFIRNGISAIVIITLAGGLLCALIILVVPTYLLTKSLITLFNPKKSR